MGIKPTKFKSNKITGTLLEEDAWERMNLLGAAGVPFVFLVDFKGTTVKVLTFEELEQEKVLFDFHKRFWRKKGELIVVIETVFCFAQTKYFP